MLQLSKAICAAGVILLAGPAVAATSFPAAVETVLMAQEGGEISKLDAAGKKELIACVNQVLTKVPEGQKRKVTEAANFDEMQDRFGELVLAEQAKWKQRIAKACSQIVVDRDGD